MNNLLLHQDALPMRGGPGLTRDALDRVEHVAASPAILRRCDVQDCTQDAEAAESFRTLAHRLHESRRIRAFSSLLVTSAVPRDGKTVVAVHIAKVLARTSAPVLLIDGDLRQARVDAALGIPPLSGLAECLEGKSVLRSVIRAVDTGLYFCPSGEFTQNPAESLQSPSLRSLVEEAESVFEWVVIDSPPIVPFADARAIASAAGGVLLVVREHSTPKEDLRQAFTALAEARVIGIVMNGCGKTQANRYYSHYSREKPARSPDGV